ncbi:AAA family ATPase [Anaerophaga thermohalophila]|jgi:recombinational DNA repair ATPase RecF|uniref:AAA family ATPase n=1 Tax=Anaerophaga thermohalophila TaxID=177400 RepID=UPI000237B94B|nr:AAA family ATPase [Anaerophaga thermohalophila]
MKIKTIEIKNYKAFYGKHTIKIGGKNVFINGENGSGKSSLYYALKDFFQSSIETIDMTEVDNIFLKASDKGKNYIKVKFQPNKDGQRRVAEYELSSTGKTTNAAGDTSIRDANKLKSFLTYKHLLDIHHIKKDGEIDLFNLLVKGVLKHFKYTLTSGKELGELWNEVETLIVKETGTSYRIDQKRKDVNDALKAFNDAFKQLFEKPEEGNPNPEYILGHAAPILDEFEHGLEIDLRYMQATTDDYKTIKQNHVRVDLKFCGQAIPKAHLFLNEARLSAIAISIYLGMIKRHPQLRPHKILFLDDIFIGLDISNRLPLLKILENHFPEYQVFITTYDKSWYEYVRGFLSDKWKTIEFYAQEVKGGFEIPKVEDGTDMVQKARQHYNNSDYKASAVYARSAFEKIIMNYCEQKRKPIAFKAKRKDYSSQDFWNKVKVDVQPATKTSIEGYRFLIYNKLSHYDPEVNPLKTELRDAITAVENLRTELNGT